MIKVMTRKEEIKKSAFDAFPNEGWERQRVAFVQGALWADENPRKGLVDIDKAYEWIADHITEYLDRSDYMAEEFRKAMEE
jgi:hypothetical protein